MRAIKFSFYLLILLVFSSTLAIVGPRSSRVISSAIKIENNSPYAISTDIHAQNDVFRVLVDVAHGLEVFIPPEVSPMGAILAKHGYEMIPLVNDDRFNQSLLATADVVMIQTLNPSISYTQAEFDALNAYWNEGGSLLLVGIPLVKPNTQPNRELNRIISSLNIGASFGHQNANIFGQESWWDHPVTQGVNSMYMRCACVDFSRDDERFSDEFALKVLYANNHGDPGLVVFENTSSSQRAILLGSVIPLWEFSYNQTNRYQLILNIFQWLTYQNFLTIGDSLFDNTSDYDSIEVTTTNTSTSTTTTTSTADYPQIFLLFVTISVMIILKKKR
ncbi:MAG: hypothetical protein ACTSQ9_08010 [Candidatus Hodarchaeales archaeon]